MSIQTMKKSGLMMKLLTPFIINSFLFSLFLDTPQLRFLSSVCRGSHGQSLKLQLTNYVIMISVMMDDIGLCRDIKENNR